MQVSQIYITDKDDAPLPPLLASASATVGSAFPKLPYVRYGDSALRTFISQHYPNEVADAYGRLSPNAYRADLGRYCLLHTLGGWYVDISVRMVIGLEPPSAVDWIAFRDDSTHFTNTSFTCSNALLFARPGHPILKAAIDRVVEHVRDGYYGTRPIDPTGPTLLGQAIALHGPSDRSVIGEMAVLTPRHSIKNRAFLLPDGQIMAWAKPKHLAKGGDLAGLGATGVNNYNELWQQRRIYNGAL